MLGYLQGFFFQFCDVLEVVIIHYKLNMKGEIFLVTYIVELIIKIWQFGNFFFFQNWMNFKKKFMNFFCIGQNRIFQIKIW